jgi:hypothetical protein
VNRYELTQDGAAFARAAAALARRVEAEGHPGVLGYRFFLAAAGREGHGVIDYADPAAWIGHHEIAMGWPEMAGLHAAARLAEIGFFGAATPEIEAWIARSALTARVHAGNRFAAGFLRGPGAGG